MRGLPGPGLMPINHTDTLLGRVSVDRSPRTHEPLYVVVPHVPGMLHDEVRRAVYGPADIIAWPEIDRENPYQYADIIRTLWRQGETFTIVEQDTVPPSGALRRMHNCHHPWCVLPHDTGRPNQVPTFGTVCFKGEMLRRLRNLAERALSIRKPMVYWRLGLMDGTKHGPDDAIPDMIASRCIPQELYDRYGPWPSEHWPSTQHWLGLDTQMARYLLGAGVRYHVHHPSTIHLGGSASQPVDTTR